MKRNSIYFLLTLNVGKSKRYSLVSLISEAFRFRSGILYQLIISLVVVSLNQVFLLLQIDFFPLLHLLCNLCTFFWGSSWSATCVNLYMFVWSEWFIILTRGWLLDSTWVFSLRIRNYWLITRNSSVDFFWGSLVMLTRDTLYLVPMIFQKTSWAMWISILTRLIVALNILRRFLKPTTTHATITVVTEINWIFVTLSDSTSSLTSKIVRNNI